MATSNEYYTTKHVPIGEVLPNPLNPRKNESIKTHDLQDIIKKRGWEEPVTAYPKNGNYILLAGHRRRFAAKKMGEETLPVYIVPPPADEQEERERIASLQSGRVDWTKWDWAIYVKDMYEAWNRPPMTKFSRALNMSQPTCKQYIDVLNYFPRGEIESHVSNKSISISSLDAIRKWIKALKKFKPDLFNKLGEDMLRKVLLEKAMTNKASRDELRNIDYIEQASEEKIKEFLIEKDAELGSEFGYYGVKKKYRNFNGNLISMGHMETRIQNMKPETDRQVEAATKALETLIKEAQEKINEINKINASN